MRDAGCTYCGHFEHGAICMSTKPLVGGSNSPCPCTSDHNAGPEQWAPKEKSLRTTCAAPALMPLTVRRCGATNRVGKEPDIHLYDITISGATDKAWLCDDHARHAKHLSGITLRLVEPVEA